MIDGLERGSGLHPSAMVTIVEFANDVLRSQGSGIMATVPEDLQERLFELVDRVQAMVEDSSLDMLNDMVFQDEDDEDDEDAECGGRSACHCCEPSSP